MGNFFIDEDVGMELLDLGIIVVLIVGFFVGCGFVVDLSLECIKIVMLCFCINLIVWNYLKYYYKDILFDFIKFNYIVCYVLFV